MRFVYVTAVWGEEVKPWLKTGLSLLLGQVHFDPDRARCLFVVYTDKEHAVAIKRRLDEVLKDTMQSDVVGFDIYQGSREESMNAWGKHILDTYSGPESIVVVLSPKGGK